MGYKQKNTSITENRASSQKNLSDNKFNKALSYLDKFKIGNRELLKMEAEHDKSEAQLQMITPYIMQAEIDREKDFEKYNKWKKQFGDLVHKKESEDFYFPEFKDWHKDRSSARIDKTEWSYSDMNVGDYDAEKIQDIMEMIKDKYGGK